METPEIRFEASQVQIRRRPVLAAIFALAVGSYFDFRNGKGGFPSGYTLSFAVLAMTAIWLHGILTASRALSVSPHGISLESSGGGSVIRIAWRDLDRAEVFRPVTGPVWTFTLRSGKKIRWTQTGFERAKQKELERVLSAALQERRIRGPAS